MEEILKGSQAGLQVDLDSLFLPGYVIEFGKGTYYQKYQDGKIICSGLPEAKRFKGKEDAELFVHRHLGYVDFKAMLCKVGWILLSAESEALESEQYWDGRRFTSNGEEPLVFSSFQEAKDCQKKDGLLDSSMIDLRVFRRKEIVMAA